MWPSYLMDLLDSGVVEAVGARINVSSSYNSGPPGPGSNPGFYDCKPDGIYH